MKKITLILSVLTMIMANSCSKEVLFGEGPLVTETRTFPLQFAGVVSSIPGKVIYKIDPVYKVEITGQRNIIDAIETYVGNPAYLQVKFKDNIHVGTHDDITVIVSGPMIYHLGIYGSGDIETQGNFTTIHLDMAIDGAGSIKVANATVDGRIDARISGSGNIAVESGSATSQDLRISGSGDINLTNIPTEEADVNISGSGDMRVNLSDRLNARISGSGSVLYLGTPAITTQISGSGTVRPM